MQILKNQQLTDMRIVWDKLINNLSIYGKFQHPAIIDEQMIARVCVDITNWNVISAFNSGAKVIKVVYSQLIINDDNKVGIKGPIKIYYQTTYNGCEFINEIIVGRNEITPTKLYIPTHNLTINLKTGKVKQWKNTDYLEQH